MRPQENKHEVLLSTEAINKRIKELGDIISNYYRDKTVTVLALTNGAMIFAADLVREMDCTVKLDTLAIDSYQGRSSTGKLNFRASPKLAVENKHILIVDDILDTGLTLDGVSSWLRSKNAASINICVLLDKKIPKRAADVEVKWAGFEVPDVFIYGYGLDRDELDRNLPFIAQVTD